MYHASMCMRYSTCFPCFSRPVRGHLECRAVLASLEIGFSPDRRARTVEHRRSSDGRNCWGSCMVSGRSSPPPPPSPAPPPPKARKPQRGHMRAARLMPPPPPPRARRGQGKAVGRGNVYTERFAAESILGTLIIVFVIYCCCRNCIHAIFEMVRCLCCCCCRSSSPSSDDPSYAQLDEEGAAPPPATATPAASKARPATQSAPPPQPLQPQQTEAMPPPQQQVWHGPMGEPLQMALPVYAAQPAMATAPPWQPASFHQPPRYAPPRYASSWPLHGGYGHEPPPRPPDYRQCCGCVLLLLLLGLGLLLECGGSHVAGCAVDSIRLPSLGDAASYAPSPPSTGLPPTFHRPSTDLPRPFIDVSSTIGPPRRRYATGHAPSHLHGLSVQAPNYYVQHLLDNSEVRQGAQPR